MDWIGANLSTILISLALLAVFGLIIGNMVKKRRRGESGCPSGCAGCALSETCHRQKENNRLQKKASSPRS